MSAAERCRVVSGLNERCSLAYGHPPVPGLDGRLWRHGNPEQGIWWSAFPSSEEQHIVPVPVDTENVQVRGTHHGPIPEGLDPELAHNVRPDTFTAEEMITTARTMDAAGVRPDAGEDAVRAVALVLRHLAVPTPLPYELPITTRTEVRLPGGQPVEQTVEWVLAYHQRRDIKNCSCGQWGSDHGHLGQSHALHVLAELRAAGLEVVRR